MIQLALRDPYGKNARIDSANNSVSEARARADVAPTAKAAPPSAHRDAGAASAANNALDAASTADVPANIAVGRPPGAWAATASAAIHGAALKRAHGVSVGMVQ